MADQRPQSEEELPPEVRAKLLLVTEVPSYPNWRRGVVYGIVGAIPFAAVSLIFWFLLPSTVLNQTIVIGSFIVAVIIMLIIGAIGAFRPPQDQA